MASESVERLLPVLSEIKLTEAGICHTRDEAEVHNLAPTSDDSGGAWRVREIVVFFICNQCVKQ